MRKRLAAVVVAGGATGMLLLGIGGPAQAACPPQSSGTPVVPGGPVYSDGTPEDGAGFVGVGGTAPTGQGGYVEASGSAGPPPDGYVVASDGTSGVVVNSTAPGPC